MKLTGIINRQKAELTAKNLTREQKKVFYIEVQNGTYNIVASSIKYIFSTQEFFNLCEKNNMFSSVGNISETPEIIESIKEIPNEEEKPKKFKKSKKVEVEEENIDELTNE